MISQFNDISFLDIVLSDQVGDRHENENTKSTEQNKTKQDKHI